MNQHRPPALPVDAGTDAALRRALLAWYRRTARDLPWRRTRDPYRIWLSEVLLQQTQVDTAQPYYERFVGAFPTVLDLAAAPLDRVLKLWEGLGYYTRARNLHRAARLIATEHGGRLPRTAAEWQRLPGVGRYTAGAIASIAIGEPVPAVDGNVKRVLARLFCIRTDIDAAATQPLLWQRAAELVSRRSPGAFNQALMDLGARICTPRAPRCIACPVRRLCQAHAERIADQLPVRRTRRPAPRIDAVAAVVQHRGCYLLVQRPPHGLLAGLWGWPGGELRDGQDHADALRATLAVLVGGRLAVGRSLGTVEHVFTHRRLYLHVYACQLHGRNVAAPKTPDARWVTPSALKHLALATVDHKVLARANEQFPPRVSMRGR